MEYFSSAPLRKNIRVGLFEFSKKLGQKVEFFGQLCCPKNSSWPVGICQKARAEIGIFSAAHAAEKIRVGLLEYSEKLGRKSEISVRRKVQGCPMGSPKLEYRKS